MKKTICIMMTVFIILSVFSSCNNNKTVDEETTAGDEETTTEEFTVKDIEDEFSKEYDEEEIKEEHTTLKESKTPGKTDRNDGVNKRPESTTTKTENVTSGKTETTTKAEQTTKAEPVTTETTTVSGTDTDKPYSCGCKNHHCKSPEDHEFVTYLENKGCPFCGSHSCPSFYALDEWGNMCYDCTKCPKYDEKKDPCIYCQHCGRRCGNGDNGTCVRFTEDIVCPICGKFVPAGTCHTHN